MRIAIEKRTNGYDLLVNGQIMIENESFTIVSNVKYELDNPVRKPSWAYSEVDEVVEAIRNKIQKGE